MCLPTLILCMFWVAYCVHSNDGIDFVDTCGVFIASNEEYHVFSISTCTHHVQHLHTHTPSDNAMLLKFSQVVPLLLVVYSLKRFYKRTLCDAIAANSVLSFAMCPWNGLLTQKETGFCGRVCFNSGHCRQWSSIATHENSHWILVKSFFVGVCCKRGLSVLACCDHVHHAWTKKRYEG